MQFDISNLNGYIELLYTPDLWNTSLQPCFNDAFYQTCDEYLLSSINKIRLLRCFNIYRFYSQLANSGIINAVKVKLCPLTKGYAYMLDRGEVHILSDLIFRSTHADLISVLLHETAHILLSQMQDYDSLLRLDVEFAEKYLKGQYDALLKTVTPVEFHAQLVTLRWMKELADYTKANEVKAVLKNEAEKAHNKLNSAVELLNKIGIK